MDIIPLTLERCKELLKSGLYFKKHCPGLTAGWKYYKVMFVDESKKTVVTQPMDSAYCPPWNPLGRVKQRIEDLSELKKSSKRRNRNANDPKPEKNRKKRTTVPKEKPKKKRRRNT